MKIKLEIDDATSISTTASIDSIVMPQILEMHGIDAIKHVTSILHEELTKITENSSQASKMVKIPVMSDEPCLSKYEVSKTNPNDTGIRALNRLANAFYNQGYSVMLHAEPVEDGDNFVISAKFEKTSEREILRSITENLKDVVTKMRADITENLKDAVIKMDLEKTDQYLSYLEYLSQQSPDEKW